MSDTRQRLANLSPERRALLMRRLQERGAQRPEAGDLWPQLAPDVDHRHEPFPLTPLQQAYWVGRDSAFDMGQVATHSYMELEGEGLDVARLEEAWNRLLLRHDMLRARFLTDGRQETLRRVDRYHIEVDDLREASEEEITARLGEVRERMSHAVLDASCWPLFELRAATLPGDRLRLFLGVDALIVDAWSVRLLFEEWAALYDDPSAELPELTVSFRDYVLGLEAVEASERYGRAREYWRERAPGLPLAPGLPMARTPGELATPRFVRRTATLDPPRWAALQERAGRAGMTATAITLAAYADVLSMWSEAPRFTLSVPQLNRRPLHPDVDRLVGEFASFILLEIDNRDDAGFADRARRHQQRLWDDLDHAEFGGVPVLRELARLDGEGGAPIMPVIFTSAPQGADGGGVGPALPERLWKVVYVNNQSSQVWLDNHLSEHDGALVCDWDTVDDLFPPGLPRDMLDVYMRHLTRLADEDDWWERSWIEAAVDLQPPDHVAVTDEINDTARPIPDERIEAAFFRRVKIAPDAIAVVTSRQRITYAELAERIEATAHRLRDHGVTPGDRVGIVMEKGWEQVVAAYAVLVTGASYLPLDAADPAGRREDLLARARVAAILTQPWLEEIGGWPEGTMRLSIGPGLESEAGSTDTAHPTGQAANTESRGAGSAGAAGDVAFVLYTSGSTGEPKAVQIEHRAVVNALRATIDEFDISEHDAALGLTALHHDMSVFDVFGVLGAGGRLVLPDPAGRRDPAHWVELMRDEGITLWNSVPAMMTMLLAYAEEGSGEVPETLRLAFLGGDWIPVTLPDRLRGCASRVEVVSVGGPTETTLWNIWHRVDEGDASARSIPYGTPIANTRYHVIGASGVERPLWAPGLLWVSGVGVTRGYLDDDAASEMRRGVHPRTGEEMWCTGDLGRRLPDGSLEFLGRVDSQVQIRGHRVELGEIEANVARFGGVHGAVAAALQDPRGGMSLAVYVVWETSPDPDGLGAYLSERLPAHMVPNVIVALDAIPLTRNGKVDRSALPDPEEAESGPDPARAVSAGDSAIEAAVLDLIEDVLSTRVTLDGNLLEYGANSIDMVRIGNRLEEHFGRRPPIDEIFRLQTARALASYYEEAGPEASGPATARTDDPVAARLAAYRVALSPEERDAFKASELGIRSDLTGAPGVDLVQPLEEEEYASELWRRRSHRRYALRPISAANFGGFLAGLGRVSVQGTPKWLYASPGGLYPTQAYVHVRSGRVEGVPGGAYYYHPDEHRLIELTLEADVRRDVHVPFVNAPIYDEAAFSIFLVLQLDAIGPAYGERSLHFATLEAGGMASTLEMWAPRWGIGLCQIGDIRFEEIRHFFRLDDGHVFIHSLVGGPTTGDGSESRDTAGGAGAKSHDRLVEQIHDLSPEEIQRLLDASQDRAGS